jgi:hypothetical protein
MDTQIDAMLDLGLYDDTDEPEAVREACRVARHAVSAAIRAREEYLDERLAGIRAAVEPWGHLDADRAADAEDYGRTPRCVLRDVRFLLDYIVGLEAEEAE